MILLNELEALAILASVEGLTVAAGDEETKKKIELFFKAALRTNAASFISLKQTVPVSCKVAGNVGDILRVHRKEKSGYWVYKNSHRFFVLNSECGGEYSLDKMLGNEPTA